MRSSALRSRCVSSKRRLLRRARGPKGGGHTCAKRPGCGDIRGPKAENCRLLCGTILSVQLYGLGKTLPHQRFARADVEYAELNYKAAMALQLEVIGDDSIKVRDDDALVLEARIALNTAYATNAAVQARIRGIAAATATADQSLAARQLACAPVRSETCAHRALGRMKRQFFDEVGYLYDRVEGAVGHRVRMPGMQVIPGDIRLKWSFNHQCAIAD